MPTTSKNDVAISVRGLSKAYTITHNAAQHTTAAEALVHRLRRPFRRQEKETFWALKDVSFDIPRGEVVGVIGRNGAGKSTLLKILSRITEPTSGTALLRGRVGSLLEVGTGFHPELTGRENIYMNGAILGMRRREIRRQFDAIVEFAEVERFLDTPVKRYSSGMYVRLAFAVAAHLNPEILIVDEVLAVGDAEFQKRCLGKMKDVAQNQDRTVLFVSHNMAVVRQLCKTCLLLDKGNVAQQGSSEDLTSEYLQGKTTEICDKPYDRTYNRQGMLLERIEFINLQVKQATVSLLFNQNYDLVVGIRSQRIMKNGALVVRIHNSMGVLVSSICTPEEGIPRIDFSDYTEVTFQLPNLQLFPGRYTLSVYVRRFDDPIAYLEAEDCLSFSVEPYVVNNGLWAYERAHGVVRISQGAYLTLGITTKTQSDQFV
jgi:lipopolysaccharide transport system ATP-binding protein